MIKLGLAVLLSVAASRAHAGKIFFGTEKECLAVVTYQVGNPPHNQGGCCAKAANGSWGWDSNNGLPCGGALHGARSDSKAAPSGTVAAGAKSGTPADAKKIDAAGKKDPAKKKDPSAP